MKKEYWFLISITLIVNICILYLINKDNTRNNLKEYLILKNQKHRIEQNSFLIFQTIIQYNDLFGSIPTTFDDKKLITLLKENIKDSIVLKLKPKIIQNTKNEMFYVYLNGPDCVNDSLKAIINENYIPTKNEIIKLSFWKYYFSKGDIMLGGSSYTNNCNGNPIRFISIDKNDRIDVENDSIRKKFYFETNNYIKELVKSRNINPSSKTYFAFCSFRFDEKIVKYSILCVRDGNDEKINNFIADLANYLKDKNIGVKEIYFQIKINESLVL